jgi:hypothetical protein
MADERRHRRLTVEGMDMHAKTMSAIEVEVIDISLSGISINSPKRLNIGCLYTLKIEFKAKVLSIKCSVMWVKLIGNEKCTDGEVLPVYTAGMEFKEVLTDDAIQIMYLLEENIRIKEDMLNGVKIRIHGHEKAILNYLQTYKVIQISLTGLDIETEQELPEGKAFFVALTLPENEITLYSKGRVTSCKTVSENTLKRYIFSIEFIDMPQKDKLKLKGFIEDKIRASTTKTSP